MIVTAWNNGAQNRNGSGYGFKLKNADRDEVFQKDWKSILLEIEEEAAPVEITIPNEAFWSENGHELDHVAIGKWLHKNGLAPWRRGNPPTFELELVKDNTFKVVKMLKVKKAF